MNWYISIDWTELSIQWMLTCGHFLWQGLVIAIVYFLSEQLAALFVLPAPTNTSLELRSKSATATKAVTQLRSTTRYSLSCVALLSLPVCVMLTFIGVHNARGSFLRQVGSSIDSAASENDSLITGSLGAPNTESNADSSDGPSLSPVLTDARDQAASGEEAIREADRFSNRVGFFAIWLLISYVILVGLLLFRLCLSLLGSFKFRNATQPITDRRLLEIVQAQATRLKLKAVPIVALCVRVSSPVVVGFLRPMILLPPSLFYGLDPTQLTAILSHEMAHIRRYDLVFNVVQRVIESLFFFHPIVWWLSRRVTIQRECCCDDVAASFVGRLTYAQALVQMASLCLTNHRSRTQAIATLAADGGNATEFGYRIRRLIDAQEMPQIRVTKGRLAFSLVTVALIWASLATLAQSPQTRKDEPQTNSTSEDSVVDGVQWSTWGDRDGLLSGARLILPEGGVHPGQSIAVEYRLKNVSAETKKLKCYVRSNWQYQTLGPKSRIFDMGIDTMETPIQITIEPGKEYVAISNTATIDTRGLSPGDYQVALGSAFYGSDETGSGTKYEIPHRGYIPLTILGERKANETRSFDSSIHWGDAISGLRLGARFPSAKNKFSSRDVVEADLWIANVTNQPIDCSIRLPHPMDGWLFNVENHLGDTIMLERPPMISSPLPQQFYEIKLAPGEVRALTSDRIEGQPDAFAGRRAKFEIVNNKEDQGRGDPTIKGRLVTRGGDYSAIYSVMLQRPDIPGLRIELDTGNCPFTVGQAHADPRTVRVLDEATDKSILWGEPAGGMRLGIRQSEFARRGTVLRHGEHLDYEVWIKNETNDDVRIARDPRDLQSPRMEDTSSINVIGAGRWLSFDVPAEALADAELVLPPSHSARRFLGQSHLASIRPPGSPRGRFGPDPLQLEPGKYSVYAQVDGLKSGVEKIEIIPAARLQIRKSSRPTDRSREYAVEDPSDAILAWESGKGEKQEALINLDQGVFIDERDLTSVELVADDNRTDQYSIALNLRPESASWLSSRIAMYSLWDDPDMVAILFDGKPLAVVHIPSPIRDDKLIIPVYLPRKQAEAVSQEIQTAIAVHHGQLKPIEPIDTAAAQIRGVTLVGEVKMPKGDWLFRRKVKQPPDMLPRERPRDFKGDTIDPEDRRLVHELTRKDVLGISVTVKANDGRNYSKSIQIHQAGNFRFDEALPVGSYQIDVNAILTLDEDSQILDGEPRADLRSGTQLLRVKEDESGDKSLEFELYPVPYNHRVLHADPSQRTTILGTLTENNHPVPNANIVLYGGIATRWKIAESVTDEQGKYRFENAIGNFIGVQVKHERLVPADGKSWRDIETKFGTTSQLDLPLTPGGFIAGKLLDENKQPRANLSLRIMLTEPGIRKGSTNFNVYATTDANGNFTSEPVFPGTYVIEENGIPYPVLGEVEVKAGQTTKL